MMKRLLATILAIIYLTASNGLTIQLHYCMGKLKSWDISSNNKANCSNCGMEKEGKKGCCHDEHKQLMVEKDQTITNLTYQLPSISADATTHLYSSLTDTYQSPLTKDPLHDHAPPLELSVPVYLRNCNFRI